MLHFVTRVHFAIITIKICTTASAYIRKPAGFILGQCNYSVLDSQFMFSLYDYFHLMDL